MNNVRILAPLAALPTSFLSAPAVSLRGRISQVMKKAVQSLRTQRAVTHESGVAAIPVILPVRGKISAISTVDYVTARRPGVRGHWKSSDRVSMF